MVPSSQKKQERERGGVKGLETTEAVDWLERRRLVEEGFASE